MEISTSKINSKLFQEIALQSIMYLEYRIVKAYFVQSQLQIWRR